MTARLTGNKAILANSLANPTVLSGKWFNVYQTQNQPVQINTDVMRTRVPWYNPKVPIGSSWILGTNPSNINTEASNINQNAQNIWTDITKGLSGKIGAWISPTPEPVPAPNTFETQRNTAFDQYGNAITPNAETQAQIGQAKKDLIATYNTPTIEESYNKLRTEQWIPTIEQNLNEQNALYRTNQQGATQAQSQNFTTSGGMTDAWVQQLRASNSRDFITNLNNLSQIRANTIDELNTKNTQIDTILNLRQQDRAQTQQNLKDKIEMLGNVISPAQKEILLAKLNATIKSIDDKEAIETDRVKKQNELQMTHDYTVGDINSTDPLKKRIAIENAVNETLKNYEGIPMQRTSWTMADDIQKLVDSGMSLSDAIRTNIVEPIQSKKEYAQWGQAKWLIANPQETEIKNLQIQKAKQDLANSGNNPNDRMQLWNGTTTTTWQGVQPTGEIKWINYKNASWTTKNIKVDSIASDSLMNALNQIWNWLIIGSSTRTNKEQQELYDKYLAGTWWLAAKPWTSLHENGLAVDIYSGQNAKWQLLSPTTEQVKVMNDNGWFQTAWENDKWHFEYQGMQTPEIDSAMEISFQKVMNSNGWTVEYAKEAKNLWIDTETYRKTIDSYVKSADTKKQIMDILINNQWTVPTKSANFINFVLSKNWSDIKELKPAMKTLSVLPEWTANTAIDHLNLLSEVAQKLNNWITKFDTALTNRLLDAFWDADINNLKMMASLAWDELSKAYGAGTGWERNSKWEQLANMSLKPEVMLSTINMAKQALMDKFDNANTYYKKVTGEDYDAYIDMVWNAWNTTSQFKSIYWDTNQYK